MARFVGHRFHLAFFFCLLLACGLARRGQAQAQASQGLVADSTELRVLRQLYAATDGPSWANRTGWLSGTTLADAGTWYGVEVNGGDVTALWLGYNNLHGTLPVVVSQLRGLRNLRLNNNALTGPIPPAYGQLTRLWGLDLSNQPLGGGIPAELGNLTELRELYLATAGLSGPIPAALGNLTQLTTVYLTANQLSGPLPAALGQWHALTLLDLRNNFFSGSIPPEWGQQQALASLNLRAAGLSGPLPAELGQLANLTYLYLSDNQLSGPVPAGLAALPRLREVDLRGNRLSGALPGPWASPALSQLLLSDNALNALPGFRGAAYAPGLTLRGARNYLTFASIEPNLTGPGQHPYTYYSYDGQYPPLGTDTTAYALGGELRLVRGLGGQRTHYQWERLVGGQWQTLAGATDSVLTVPADASAQGLYRTRATNDWATGLTLYSKSIYAHPQATESVSLPCPPLPLAVSPAAATVEPGDRLALRVQAQPAGQALSFDGIDDQVILAPGAPFADVVNTFTVEAWARPTAPHCSNPQYNDGNAERYLFMPANGSLWGADHAGMGLSVGTDGVRVYEHGTNYLVTTLTWAGTLTGWTHLAVVYQDRVPSLYVNGTLVAQGHAGTKPAVHPSPGLGGDVYGYYQGQADEVRFWRTARSAAELRAASAGPLRGTGTGLVGYWPLNEGTGTHTQDASGLGPSGELLIGRRWSGSFDWDAGPWLPQATTTGPQWVESTVPFDPSDMTYAWSPAAGLSATSGAQVTASPTQTTTYTVTATPAAGSSCAPSTAQVTVTVQAPPALQNPPTDNCSTTLAQQTLADRSRAKDLVNYVRTYTPRVALTDLAPVATGSLLREAWLNIDQTAVDRIPLDQLPRTTSQLASFEAIDNSENYGARLRGYLVPPVSGAYTFWLAGDDNCALWLSADDDPAGKVQIAAVPEWTNPGEWTKYAAQQAAPVTLVAGRRYYVEALHKQAGGGGHVAVRWLRPDGVDQGPIPGAYLAPYVPTRGTGPQAPVFYRALNLGGGDLLLDGLRFEASREAPNFALQGAYYGAPGVPEVPATDAVRADLLHTLAFDNNLALTLQQVPAGTYEVFAYVWEDDASQTLDFTLNGQPVLTGYATGPAGTWRKLGPFTTTLAAPGTLVFAGSGGEVVVSGLEVWRVPVLRPKEELAVTTQYLDGLGRPVQTVQRQASPGGNDVVVPVAYDALGRQPKDYLPYVSPNPHGVAGAYRPDALRQQDFFYRGAEMEPGPLSVGVARTGAAYSQKVFEPSPLNRVLRQGAPGEAWQPTLDPNATTVADHAVHLAERPNTTDDAVTRFTVGYDTDPTPNQLTAAGAYAVGELWLTETTDENGSHAREFKDKEGQVVAKQVQATANQWLTTHYVYDEFNHLRAVVPPKATELLATGNQQVTAAVDSLLFRYRYDGQGRVVAKQVPGQAGEVQTVYDQLDRPVLTQDAQQRLRQEWSWSKYDALGRVVLTGLVTRNATAAQLQAEADGTATQYEDRTAAGPHYYTTENAYPRLGQNGFSGAQVLTVSYYDDYNFDTQGANDAAYSTAADNQFSVSPVADGRVTGLVTRTKTKVLGVADAEPGAWLIATTFYDEKARPIQVVSTNARGGQDVVTTQLDFVGQVVKSYAVHEGYRVPERNNALNHEALAVAETFAYDHMGRLLEVQQQVAGADPAPVTIDTLRYNEVGQLVQKTLSPDQPALRQQVDYTYNTRGWLQGLNEDLVTGAPSDEKDLWGLQLSYACGFAVPQYNGNLSGQKWRSKGDGVARAYGYLYDPANRLAQGDFVAQTAAGTWSAEQQRYGMSNVRYDANGNILALQRRGLLEAATRAAPRRFGATDDLTYKYQGNRLVAVDDAVRGNALPQAPGSAAALTSLAGDFQEKSRYAQTQQAEYGYDANGNLTRDANKGIAAITYNHLNLPVRIEFAAQDYIEFRYAASGQKVAKLVYTHDKPGQPTRTDYLGAYQYESDSLRFFPHAEGRVLRFVSPTSGQVSYAREYSLKDHLGNLRLAYRLGTPATYTASMEPVRAQTEEAQWDAQSLASTRFAAGALARTSTAEGGYVARLNAAQGKPIGPLKMLAVHKGDTLDVLAPGFYPQPVSSTSTFSFSLLGFVTQLLQQPAAPTLPTGEASPKLKPLPFLGLGLAVLPSLPQTGRVPKGYLRVLTFNEDSALVAAQTITQPLTELAASNYENLRAHLVLAQDGYVQVYVGNESDADVFFDDVQIDYHPGLLVQENHYDPWGLNLMGIDRLGGVPENQYQYSSKEKQQDFGLNWLDYGARLYDPQLGQWHVVDPLADKMRRYSPYNYGFDNPVRYTDPDGKAPGPGPIDGSIGLTRLITNLVIKVFNAALNFEMPRDPGDLNKEGGSGGGIPFVSEKGNGTGKGREQKSGTMQERHEEIGDIVDQVSMANTAAGAKKLPTKDTTFEGIKAIKDAVLGSESAGEAAISVIESSVPSNGELPKGTHQDTVILSESTPILSEGKSGSWRTTERQSKVGDKIINYYHKVRTGPPTQTYH